MLPLVYEELRKLAAHKMASEAPGQTLQPTALVHEAYVKLFDGADRQFAGQSHFLAVASRVMRQVLVDYVRSRSTKKRFGGAVRAFVVDRRARSGQQ